VIAFGSGNSITLTNVTAAQALHSVLITPRSRRETKH
jgi:hypothetical protein